jgi:hypothetical protein
VTDHHPNPLGDALRDRVRDEHPDLDRLVQASTRTGGRIRRRRLAGTILASVAAVVAVTAGAQQLVGDGPTTGRDPGFASVPSAAPTSAAAPTPSADDGSDLITLAELSNRLENDAEDGGPAPFRVGAANWACDPPADEKFLCTRGDDTVHLVWRDAASRPKHLGPDGAGPGIFVSEAHDGVFVTVEPLDGTAPEAATEVGESLVFD